MRTKNKIHAIILLILLILTLTYSTYANSPGDYDKNVISKVNVNAQQYIENIVKG